MKRLVLHGGERTVTRSLVEWPWFTDGDKRAIIAVVERGELWGAVGLQWTPRINKGRSIGMKYALSRNSGTACLHMALAAADNMVVCFSGLMELMKNIVEGATRCLES